MEIDIKEYFTEIIDESRSTIGYSLNPYKDIDLVKAIYEQNEQLQQLKEENEELKNRLQILDDEILTVEITMEEFETYKKHKQAFEKIKELAEKIDDYACEWCDDLHNDFIDASREIQDISEVKNDVTR